MESLKLYLEGLFGNLAATSFAFIGSLLVKFFFPETQYLYGALAVLGIMILDCLTKLYALKKKDGSWKKAFCRGSINSESFFKGTFDKLIVFGVALVLCGAAYRLMIISDIAAWFTQGIFILMFLRDTLSIFENLRDAGVGGLRLFEKMVKKKLDEFCPPDEDEPSSSGDAPNSNCPL